MEKGRIRGTGAEVRDLLPLTPAVLNILLAVADEAARVCDHARGRGADRRADQARPTGTLLRFDQAHASGRLDRGSDERPDPALDDQRRRYYRITDFGRRVAGAEAGEVVLPLERRRAPGPLFPWSRDLPYRGRVMSPRSRAYLRGAAQGMPGGFQASMGCRWSTYSAICTGKRANEVGGVRSRSCGP